MRSLIRSAAITSAGLVLLALPARAQQAAGVSADLLTDLKEVQDKLTSLAKAMPDAGWNWRPGTGVRSTGEVVQHIAADNWFMPVSLGSAAPAATGIKAGDYKTVQTYETRKMDRATAMAEMEQSFAFLRKAISDTPPASMNESVQVFGRSFTRQQVWIMATTHLHEHLGQLIAYARTNNVVPPWSRGN